MPPAGTRQPRVLSGLVLGTLALCVLIQSLPLLLHGPLPLGSDVFSTSHYLQGFMKAFAEGDFYPRWTDQTNQGLGAPSFVMFPPLTYYGASGASWLTGSIISGFKLYLILVAAAAGLAFYALARQWIGPGLPAALAAGIYLLLPYHVLDRYQRFAMSETTAFVFVPLILLFARRTVLAGLPRDFLGLAAAYAALLYTHIVSALLFSILLGPWLLWESRGRWRSLPRVAAGLACGLALAAPSLLPAAIEKSHANIAWNREMPNGDYHINFIFRDDVLPGLLPGLSMKDPVKPLVLRSAHSQLLLAGLAGALALVWTAASQTRRRDDVMALMALCAGAYFLQLEISTPVWDIMPELASIQFPWRFQTVMVLAAALLSGFALSAGWGRAGGKQAMRRPLYDPAGVAIAAVLAVNLLFSWWNVQAKPFQYDEPMSRLEGVVNWIEPAFTPVQFPEYKRFKTMGISMPQAAFVQGEGKVEVKEWLSSTRRLGVASDAGGRIALRSFWFPGWTATIDGAPLPLSPSTDIGVTTFLVPAGGHEVALRFASTPVRRAAGYAAGVGLLMAPMLAWRMPRATAGARHAAAAEG